MEKFDGFFLDTNVFESANFDLKKKNIKIFFELCEEYGIKVYIDKVVENEILNRIRKKPQEIAQKFKKNDLPYLCNILGIEVSHSSLENKISEYLNPQIDEILGKVNIIDSNIDPDKLIQMYFEQKPPFGVGNAKNDKKSEFPDALIMLSLKKHIEKTQENILVISNDLGIKRFCQEHNIVCKKFISDALNEINAFHHVDINNFVETNKSKIEQEIKNQIKEKIDFIIYGYGPFLDDVEVEDYEVEDIEINNLGISYVSKDNMLTITVLAKITFLVETRPYPDFERASHDSEDDVWYVFGKLKTKFYLTQELELEFEINITSDKHKKFEMNFISTAPEIEFDIYNLHPSDIIDNQYLYDENWSIYKL